MRVSRLYSGNHLTLDDVSNANRADPKRRAGRAPTP